LSLGHLARRAGLHFGVHPARSATRTAFCILRVCAEADS
jgi:hypothetical protein